MNIFLARTCLITAAGMIGVFTLVGVMQSKNVQSQHLLHRPVYQEESRAGMTVVTVTGPEGEVPQKLIEQLNSKGDGNEKR